MIGTASNLNEIQKKIIEIIFEITIICSKRSNARLFQTIKRLFILNKLLKISLNIILKEWVLSI